jgi:GxxExxY protein
LLGLLKKREGGIGVAGEELMERVDESGALHSDLTYRIIGCAQTVHSVLGPGFPEGVYHKALSHEIPKARIPVENQKEVDVFYDGVLCGEYRLDLLVDGKVVVELKAVDSLIDSHLAQMISYLKATGLEVGLLLNFGTKSLQVRRVVL